MGSCVSVHKNPESAMKLQIPSPVKEKPPVLLVDRDPTVAHDGSKPKTVTSFRGLGSKEETFFDSQPWLESDCEDDFFSVNGDFTPSRGSTPVHHSFSVGTLQISRSHFGEKAPASELDSSFGEKKKRLSDLFKESLRIDPGSIIQDAAEEAVKPEAKETTLGLPPQSASGTPYVSGAISVRSSETTPSGGLRSESKSINPVQCCLPRLHSTRSFNERKKKMIPIPSVG